jgi:3'-5' exoribonuclease
MGKIHEIETAHGFDYTREGNLVGHVVMGHAMVENAIAGIEGFPDKLRVELGHLILSHQGKLEFGAPVVPMCAEAILLHYVDDLDVRINVFRRVTESNASADSEFLEKIWPLESRVYRGIEPDSGN